MTKKKIGLLCMALVLALGALGVGYAAWVDNITISGTVTTGSLDINPVYYSSTYIYKDLTTENISVYHVVKDAQDNVITSSGTIPSNPELVASAVATADGEDAVKFTYEDLFPCQTLTCDVVLKYEGSVPAKVNHIGWSFQSTDGKGDWLTPLVGSGDIVGYARIWDANTKAATETVVDESYQLHDGDYVIIWLDFHLPQEDTLMTRSGSATANFQVVQWNEYPYPTTPTP